MAGPGKAGSFHRSSLELFIKPDPVDLVCLGHPGGPNRCFLGMHIQNRAQQYFYGTMLAAVVFGVLMYFTLPACVVALNDDFGYLRSVVQTLQHGRPWTDDWLEPWAASLSVFSASLYLLTGRFYFATYGLLAVLSAVSFYAFCRLYRERGFSAKIAVLVAGLVFTSPTILWKEIEYTGMALHLPCLLLVIYFAEKKHWGLFLVVWMVAIANRQSALAWLTIPALELCLLGLVKPGRSWRAWWPLLLVTLAGVLWFGLLSLGMNRTHAQVLITSQSLAHINWPQARLTMMVGTVVFLIAVGIGNLLFCFAGRIARPRWKWYWLQILISLAGVKLLSVNQAAFISFEHPGYDYGVYSSVYIKIVLGLALAGWLRPGISIDLRKAVYAFSGLGLVSLRSGLWDYYLIDAAILGLLCPRGPAIPVEGDGAQAPYVRWIAPGVVGLSLLAAGYFQAQIIYRLKLLFIDHPAAICRVTEESLRHGRLRVDEIGHTNIGYMGWHLQPHYIVREGKQDAGLVGFTRYLKSGSVGLSVSPMRRSSSLAEADNRPDSANPGHIGTGVYPTAWIYFQRYTLNRLQPEPTGPVVADDFVPCPFPLTNAEWSDLIGQRGLWAPGGMPASARPRQSQ